MTDDAKPEPKTPSRDALRAQALRANLMRRKAQARERSESEEALPPEKPKAETPGSA